MSSKIKISGKVYTRKSCSSKKTEAKKQAEAIRKKGNTARVIKNGTAYCVYTGPKRRTTKKSKTSRTRTRSKK